MKHLLFIAALFFTINTNAQITKATLQASGLTCSMCSNAINKSLKSLEFVEKVEANIKNSSFDITFKPGSKVDIDKLKEKVEDAGFFVAALSATVHFNNMALTNDSHIEIDGSTFHFLNVKDQTVDGNKTIKVLDKGYVTAKAFKQNSKYTTMECYKTGKAAACCTKAGTQEGTRIYHVTI
jgi:copper chaperone CopZ